MSGGKILVTGAAGFLGSHVTRQLVANLGKGLGVFGGEGRQGDSAENESASAIAFQQENCSRDA